MSISDIFEQAMGFVKSRGAEALEGAVNAATDDLADPIAKRFLDTFPQIKGPNWALLMHSLPTIMFLIKFATPTGPVGSAIESNMQRVAKAIQSEFEARESKQPQPSGGADAEAKPDKQKSEQELNALTETYGKVLSAVSLMDENKQQVFLLWYLGLGKKRRESFNKTMQKQKPVELNRIVKLEVAQLNAFMSSIEEEEKKAEKWTNFAQMRKAIEESNDADLVNDIQNFIGYIERESPEFTKENKEAFWDAVFAKTPSLPKFKEMMSLMQGPNPLPERVVKEYGFVIRKPGKDYYDAAKNWFHDFTTEAKAKREKKGEQFETDGGIEAADEAVENAKGFLAGALKYAFKK